jgi:2-haloacid dehalogenase
LGSPPEATWLVSANAWDVIGAKAAGLRAAWVRRSADAVYDPWDLEPDLVVDTLQDLAGPWGTEPWGADAGAS